MFQYKIICISVLLGVKVMVLANTDYNDLYDDEEADYYQDYYDTMPAGNDNSSNRAKRYQDKSTMNLEDLRDVKGALQQILPNMEAVNSFTPYSTETTYATQYFEDSNASTPFTMNTKALETFTVAETELSTSSHPTETEQNKYKLTTEDHFKDQLETAIPRRSSPYPKSLNDITDLSDTTDNIDSIQDFIIRKNKDAYDKDGDNIDALRTPTEEATTFNETETMTTLTTRPTKSRELDIPRLLSIIADLASEFETNLTRKLNETLFNMSIPTCTTPTTEPPTTSEYDANYTGSTIAKCFVCGLDIPGIPQHAHCADAFAGDFLPLVPVDPSAKGKISNFRKYCKYSNIPGYVTNLTHSRAIYGRWTGGCAVRWIDLSGIYTQRTCRNRLKPTTGKHFASKRMAKLERSLWNIENGCIISPVATLTPLSRGISLYARFHACVCTGNWCNSAFANKPWTPRYLILLLFGICVTQYSNINSSTFYT